MEQGQSSGVKVLLFPLFSWFIAAESRSLILSWDKQITAQSRVSALCSPPHSRDCYKTPRQRKIIP